MRCLLFAAVFLCTSIASAAAQTDTTAAPARPDSSSLYAPADTSTTPEPLLLSYHDFDVYLPQTPGWDLVQREPERQSVTIRNESGQGADKFVHGEVTVARAWEPQAAMLKTPEAAFEKLARAEVAAARAIGGITWLGSQTDTLGDGKRIYQRLRYGIGRGHLRADGYVVAYYPPTFATDGFYYQFVLNYYSRPDLQDPSVVQEFYELVHSTEFHPPLRDPRIVPAGADSLGKAKSSLPFVYYDLRAQAASTPLDSTVAPCWVQLEDSLSVEIAPTVYKPATFFSFRDRTPPPGVREHGDRVGKVFDRNGDGRFDIAFFRQGIVTDMQQRQFLAFYAVADDNFDGKVDTIVYEDGDQDGDGASDHLLYGQDRSGGGVPDRLWQFTNDITRPIKPVTRQGTRFFVRRSARPQETSFDLDKEFADWTRYLGAIDRAAAECRK